VIDAPGRGDYETGAFARGFRAPRFRFARVPRRRGGKAQPGSTAKKPAGRLRGQSRIEHQDKTMFAVIKTGGKQLRVAAEDKVTVMYLAGEPGDAVTFGEVLALTDGDKTTVGAPFVAGASVAGKIVAQTRGKKVIAFKKRRRKHSERKRGHRQDLTVVRITSLGGDK
jgi:large subunit ribosomal protein L21